MQRDKIKPILFSIIKHSSKEELRRQIPKDIVSGVLLLGRGGRGGAAAFHRTGHRIGCRP